MSLADRLRALAERAPTLLGHLATEEATKTALVLPFLSALGYDVFNPTEVIPEFTADVGVKKGEKVDYAVKKGDEVVMLFECKPADVALGANHKSQLFRYFTVTRTRIAVLTNGLEYRFYSDLEEANKMDERPFLVLDLLALRDDALAQVEKLTKDSFLLNEMLSAAGEMKHLREIRLLLDGQFEAPDEDFVRFFHSRVSSGRFTASAKEQFSELVKRALTLAIADRVSGRLRSALEAESEPTEAEPAVEGETEPPESTSAPNIVTTEEELEGYRIVKAIACSVLPADRIVYRDSKTYFAVLADDNNRKPVCRLWFNTKQKYLGLFDEEKKEERHPIETVEDLYGFADQLREAARRYTTT